MRECRRRASGRLADQVRRDAIADAEARAKILVQGLGVTLGPVITIAEAASVDGGYYGVAPEQDGNGPGRPGRAASAPTCI